MTGSAFDRLKETMRQRQEKAPIVEPTVVPASRGSALGRLRRVMTERTSGPQITSSVDEAQPLDPIAALKAKMAGRTAAAPPTQKSPSSPRPVVVREEGPATRAHGNEAPMSQVGAMSFDPAKLGAPMASEDSSPDDAAPSPAPGAPKAATSGIRVWEDEGRVKVSFPERPRPGSPEAQVMAALKSAGFYWWGPGKAWTKRASDEARRQAQEAVAIAGVIDVAAAAEDVAPTIVLTHEQAANRLASAFKSHGARAEVYEPQQGSWRKQWTVNAYYIDRVGRKKKYHQQDLGRFLFKPEGGVGLGALEVQLSDQRQLARQLLERGLRGVRVLSADEEASGATGTPDAATLAEAAVIDPEALPAISREEAASRIKSALQDAGLGPGVLVLIERGTDKQGNPTLYVLARAQAKKYRKFVDVSYGRFIVRQRGGVGLDAVRAEYGEREPQARLALEKALSGVRVLPRPDDEPPPEPPPSPASPTPPEPPTPGSPQTEYALPDGGRVELGRSMGIGGETLAIHYPPRGRMRSLHLVNGTEVSAPIVQRHPSPTEDDLVLFAALAADLGSMQAKADHEAALAARPSIPPALSDRAAELGWWVIRHDRNAGTIVLRRKPFSGAIADYEQRELTKLGIQIRSQASGQGVYSEERWERVLAWARRNAGMPVDDSSASPPGAAATLVRAKRLGPVRADTPLSRTKAAERIAALLRTRGYAADVLAPAGAYGPIRVAVAREGANPKKLGRYEQDAVGWIWMLLDGRLRVEPAGSKDSATVTNALEQIAKEALAGLEIVRRERDAETRTIGPFEILEDEAGGWIARTRGDQQGESFVTLREAESYARRVAAQRTSQIIPAEVTAKIQPPTIAGRDEDGDAVTFDFGAAKIDRWADGAPVIALSFELREKDGGRRGELHAWERVDREHPGAFTYVRGYVADDGERYGAQAFTSSTAPAWVRDVMRPLIAAIPVQIVDFDGARVEPTADGIRVRLDDEPSERTRRALRRGKFRRVDARDGWVWTRDRDGDAWWWARHVAIGVQSERETARGKDRLPESQGGEISHRTFDATDALQAARAALASSEQYARHQTRSIVRKEKTERAAREARSLLSQRDHLIELRRLYREDGSRRPMGERAPEMRDFHAALPTTPTRVARGIDVWERDGRVQVRLGAEPSEWLGRILHLQAFSRSRKRGEERIWWQPSSPLASYWAHWIAEHEAEKDANSSELVAERFAGELPAEEAWTLDAQSEPLLSSTSPDLNPPVVTMSMRLAERIVALAEPGKYAGVWEEDAREELAFENEIEREQTVRAVRDRILRIEGGTIVGDDWLVAFKRAWGGDRRILLAARLFADQAVVVEATTLARDRRERAEQALAPEDADRIDDEALKAHLPAGLSAADRQRGRRALGDALVALGLADRKHRELRTARPDGCAPAWGWLIRHEMRRDRRVEMPESWALRESLAARLLGYSEGTARWAMTTAITEGWFAQNHLAGEARVFFSEVAEKPAPSSPRRALPAAPPKSKPLVATIEGGKRWIEDIAGKAREALSRARREYDKSVWMRENASGKLSRARSEGGQDDAKKGLYHANTALDNARDQLAKVRVLLDDHDKIADNLRRHFGASFDPPVPVADVDELGRAVEKALAESEAQAREVWPEPGAKPADATLVPAGGMRTALAALRTKLGVVVPVAAVAQAAERANRPAETAVAPAAQWVTGDRLDRSGMAKYVHIIRAKDDPERGDIRKLPEALRDRAAAWRRALKQTSVESWKWAIWQLLSDGQARTFNRIGVELLDKTADVLLELPPDAALWALVAEERVEHTLEAPILFRLRAGATPPTPPTPQAAPESAAPGRDAAPEPPAASKPSAAPSPRLALFRWSHVRYSRQKADALREATGVDFEPSRKGAFYDPYETRALDALSPAADALRAAIRDMDLGREITEHDVTDDFVLGRTLAPPSLDRGATTTLSIEPDGSRIVAVARRDLPWQAARYEAAWLPFDTADAVETGSAPLVIEGVYRLAPLSDGTWVVSGHRRGVDGKRLARDFHHALQIAENRRAADDSKPAPWPEESPAPRADRVRVTGWRDGGPVVEFPLVWPSSDNKEAHFIVSAYVPSAAKRVKGDRWRRVEKTELTVTENGAPRSLGYDLQKQIQNIAFTAIEELPADAREKPKGPTRTPAPFSIGQGVRFIGETAHGLESGSIGVVDHILRPRDTTFDLSEVVFPNGHVEVVGADGVDGRFEVLGAGETVPALPEEIGGTHVLGLARTRGVVRLLEAQVSSARAMAERAMKSLAQATSDVTTRLAKQAFEQHTQEAEAAARRFWRAERVVRLSLAAAKDAPEEQAAPVPEPEPLPVPEDIEARRAAFAEKREARIDGLRAAGEKRMTAGEALYKQTKQLLDMIPLGQPNIVDTVSGRRFTRQREKLHERHERSWSILKEGEGYLARAAAAEANTAISSDDPDAIDKLKEQIAEREAAQEHAKAINVAARAGDRAKLAELGLSEAKIADVLKPDFAGRVGISPFVLANNNNQIRRLRERIALLEKQRREGPKEPEKFGAVEVREEDNRVRIFFPTKPSDQDRDWLKRQGFKWAPSVPAWQRHASPQAWHYAREIARKIGGPPEGVASTADAAEGTSELGKLVMRIATRVAESSKFGLAEVGNVVDEARTFSGKDKEQVHEALRELEDAGLIELRSWSRQPAGPHATLAPHAADGALLVFARPLAPAGAENSDDPIIGYRLLLTMVVDHPERRDSTYPAVLAGHRYDDDVYVTERATADRRIAELRAGSTEHDSASEYVAELGLAAVTRRRSWAGWVVGPEPRERPALPGGGR